MPGKKSYLHVVNNHHPHPAASARNEFIRDFPHQPWPQVDPSVCVPCDDIIITEENKAANNHVFNSEAMPGKLNSSVKDFREIFIDLGKCGMLLRIDFLQSSQ